MKVDLIEKELIESPATSYWLKEQLDRTKNRDPVDALADAEILVEILRQRVSMALARD